ncbi:hypothetical protein B0H94_106102 [Salsuginibacillus halophilus]|uniref:CsbD family protein n=1 Tax=Salsuginibacillus halophilus TaxID=517424 RepID=A0A2P8HI15_9BACI|nr:CsbD family protein [Salsuginibacillus halophilus]PSL45847.1 hypothetical protein B0H94_106102 [Salsuginibacillus halophilus]
MSEIMEGLHREVRGKVHKSIHKLTGDRLEQMLGRRNEAIGKIQRQEQCSLTEAVFKYNKH